MKKTEIFENANDFAEFVNIGNDTTALIDNRVCVIKDTKTIRNKEYRGFTAESEITAVSVKTAVKKFIKTLNADGFKCDISMFTDDNGNICGIDKFISNGYKTEIEPVFDGYYIACNCYQESI